MTSRSDGHDRRSSDAAGHDRRHEHVHAWTRPGQRHQGRLLLAFALMAVLTVVEVVAGAVTNSLALISDAGHMLTDVIGLAMALAAIQLASRGTARRHRTFGLYRLEILAALANAVLLFGVAIYVLVEATRRLTDAPDVMNGPMLVVAVIGLAANVAAFALLRSGSHESINVEGAYLEVLADLVGSVGVIAGAIVIGVTGWEWVDPAVGAAIGVWILPRTWRLGGRALRILVQAAPPGIDLDAVQAGLTSIAGVVDVHDLHVWTLTSDMEVASAHLTVDVTADGHSVLDQARSMLQDRHGIAHATIQIEPEDHKGCDEVAW